MRALLGLIAATAVLRGAGSLWFGGERLAPQDDVDEPTTPAADGSDQANWHHQDLTGRACRERSFADGARRSVQWHADYIDSYMYNPLFWAQGGLTRAWRAFMLQEHLVKLHFDDLMDADAIGHMWVRYMAGTVAGLQEAAGRGDVAAGRHLVGLSLHAIQDFYSHSNWVDDPDVRRKQSYLERMQANGWGRITDQLYTGTYERPDTQGVASHGHYRFLTPMLRREPLNSVLGPICSSPLSSLDICVAYRETIHEVSPGVDKYSLPGGVVGVTPNGIALDNRWICEVSAKNRKTRDGATGAALFAAAKALAQRDSVRWLTELERVMGTDPSTAAFWTRIRTDEPVATQDRTVVYEDVSRLPVLFTAAGDYPPASATLPADDAWYLYLQVGTGSNGTNAEVTVVVDGKPFRLDHGAMAHVVTGYNDFQSGSTVAYAVGPLSSRPGSLVIKHSGRSISDLAQALASAAARVGQSIVNTAVKFLPGGEDDFVGRNYITWNPNDLDGVKRDRRRGWSMRIESSTEGTYEFTGSITYDRDVDGPGPAGSPAARISEFTVTLETVHCIRESKDDGLWTPADEAYFLTSFTNHTGLDVVRGQGPVEGWESGMWTDVDSGERTNDLRHSWSLRVPTVAGSATLGIEAWESDNDTASTRRDRLANFTQALGDRKRSTLSDVADIMGSALEDGWDLRSLRAFAFQRRRGGSGWAALNAEFTPRMLTTRDGVNVTLTPTRSGTFSLFGAATPPAAAAAPVRLGPTSLSGSQFDDATGPRTPVTAITVWSGDVVDGVQLTHQDGAVDPVRGASAAPSRTIRFTDSDPLVGLSGMRGTYYGSDAVTVLNLHFRSGRTERFGNGGQGGTGAGTPFTLTAPDPSRQRMTGLFGSASRYLSGIGVVVA